MLVAMEGLIMAFWLLLICVVGISNGRQCNEYVGFAAAKVEEMRA